MTLSFESPVGLFEEIVRSIGIMMEIIGKYLKEVEDVRKRVGSESGANNNKKNKFKSMVNTIKKYKDIIEMEIKYRQRSTEP